MKSAKDMTMAAVLGAGTMGAGIAQVAAQVGIAVRLFDVELDFARKGVERITAMLDKGVAKGKVTAEARDSTLALVEPHDDVEGAVAGADVVIEAAPENLQLKRDLFSRISQAAGPDALLATNTSSLSVTAIAEAADGSERVLGMHFFNPPPLMKLLEIVRGERTSEEAVQVARDLAERMGKQPIVVKDSPGFASSRLGVALGLEAMRMVEEDVASPADIDAAMKLGYRHPMGPLELTDLVGLDVRLSIAEYLAKKLDDSRFQPPAILRRLVDEGHVGKKSGRGFYRWVDGKPESP